jgi:hypothetical protein
VKRLEDIPKKQPFTVPDGYFDDLPMRIQARIQAPQTQPFWATNWGLSLKLAIPVLTIGVVAILFWKTPTSSSDPFAKLDTIPSEQLLAYLEEDAVTTEEVIENGIFTSSTINTLYSEDEEISSTDINEMAQQYDFNF